MKQKNLEHREVLSITHMGKPFPTVITDLAEKVTEIRKVTGHYILTYPGDGLVYYWVKGKFTVPGFGTLLLPEWREVEAEAGEENVLGFLPYPNRIEHLWAQPTGDGLLKRGRVPWKHE